MEFIILFIYIKYLLILNCTNQTLIFKFTLLFDEFKEDENYNKNLIFIYFNLF
jgi:hypothetical protein